MGRIFTEMRIVNAVHPDRAKTFRAVVDTGATYLMAPVEWEPDLGLRRLRTIDATLADGSTRSMVISGPALIFLEGTEVSGEIAFMPGLNQPLLGYVPLEQARLIADTTHHRLVSAGTADALGMVTP